jgi:predicted MPP superfamily phosphohydrolase
MNKTYIIQGRGYFPIHNQQDYTVVGVETSDIHWTHDQISFTGTEKQLQQFLKKLMKDEKYFKVIGIHEHNEEEEQYYKQLLTNK